MPMAAWDAVGSVTNVKPNCTPDLALQFLNRRIRNVLDEHRFSDFLKTASIVIPDQYTTGTVTLTGGSATVNGTGTGWVTNDRVNTTITEPVNENPGYVEISPASMAGISEGDYLLLDVENNSLTEIVIAQNVGIGSFWAYCRQAHSGGVSLLASLMTGRQFKPGAGEPVYTIRAVLSATQLSIDNPYGGPPLVDINYQIYKGYAVISTTARRLRYCWDPVAGQAVGCNKTVDWLNTYDPQRTDTGNQPLELVSTFPTAGGILQWEIYPAQTSAYSLMVIYDDGWPTLINQNDLLPPALNPQIFVAGATADALRSRFIQREGKTDPYYDLNSAQIWEAEYQKTLDNAIQMDQGRYMTHLKSYQDQIEGQGTSYNWLRAHAVESTGVGWL